MTFYLQEKYVSLLTDFGFKRVFGTEPNKHLLMDFLNTLLPEHHQIQDLSFKSTENLGITSTERKAIFDIYCEAANGDRFIVEMQKTKQNFFKDRSVYYATFPIQEQGLRGNEWNFDLKAVYTIGILDFVFNEHKDDDRIVHDVQLKDQDGDVFYDKLRFIYIQLPKFKKTVEELHSHLDKWLYLLRYLPNITDTPPSLQEPVFDELFDVAELANFSIAERLTYEDSLKYYRDINNIMNTARQEGEARGKARGRRSQSIAIIIKLLSRRFGPIAPELETQINNLSNDRLDAIENELLEFESLQDLINWLK